MGSRKNIWDILESRQVDISREYSMLWDLFNNQRIVKSKHNSIYTYTFTTVINDFFLEFKSRGSIISYADFLDALKIKLPRTNIKLADLDLLIELILLVFDELNTLKTRYDYGTAQRVVENSIVSILEKTNQKIVVIKGKGKIIVPNDEVVTTVSDVILPDDEQLALEILGYSHYSRKNDVEAKRKILNRLGSYIEPRLKRNKNSDISFVLNKYFIRHGDDENKKNIQSLSTEEMSELYDGLYREILHYILEQEHKKFQEHVKELKINMNG